MTTTVILPAITTGDVQKVSADLTKFDAARAAVEEARKVLRQFRTIDSKEKLDQALEAAKAANAMLKAIDNRRKELGEPFVTEKKQIDEYAKRLSQDLEADINLTKTEALRFQKEQEQIALQKRTTAREKYMLDIGFTYDGTQERYHIDGVGTMSRSELVNYDDNSFNSITSGFVERLKRQREEAAAKANEDLDMAEMFGSKEQVAEVIDTIKTVTEPLVAPPAPTAPVVEKAKGLTKRWTFEVQDANQVPREYLTVDEKKIREAVQAGARTIPGVRIYQSESIALR